MQLDRDQAEISRLRWRCRRGMLELDLILDTAVVEKYPSLSPAEKIDFELLLEQQDSVLLGYLHGSAEPDDLKLKDIIKKIT